MNEIRFKRTRKFFKILFCIHIWKTTKQEPLFMGDPFWKKYAITKVCLKCGKSKIKQIRV